MSTRRRRRGPEREVPGYRLVAFLIAAALLAGACAPTSQAPAPTAQQPAAPVATAAKPAVAAPPTTKAQQPAATAAQPKAPRTLTVAYTQDLESWNPYGHSGSTSYARYMHIAEPLLYRDQAKNDWLPLLAESWEATDPNTWQFKLRQGVKFHDGTEMTADDVIFSFRRMIDDPESKQQSTLNNVSEMSAPDKYTVVIKTKNPDATFFSRLDNRSIWSKAHYERLGTEQGDRQLMGTGPYKFKEWLQGQRLVLVKNEQYQGPFKSEWDEVIFRPIPESEARITALVNGEVDIIANVPPQDVERLNQSGQARAVGVRGKRMMFAGINPISEPLKNVKVRQAINHAINKEAIIKGVLQGRAYALDLPVGPSMYSYTPNLQPQYSYDLERAKQLMIEAGYPNGFETEFYTPVDRYIKDRDVSAAIVDMLSNIGIRASLKTPEWSTFSDEYQQGIYPMFLIGRGSVDDPSEYLHQYFRTNVTKRLLFSDPEVDAALIAEQKEFNKERRLELLQQAQQLIMQEAPVAYLFQYEDTYGVHNRVQFDPRPDEYVFAWDARPQQ